ncbi:hypothetical protein [Thauera sp.]|uniref:hypothetical protein n=1 Tax=Thauera sp. TaxID=1905334 RepID=UPI00257A6F93|nr:hypothetical protein [Thauera sp.]
MAHPPPLLDAEQAAFISSGLSISAAACQPGALPNLARATGCRVSTDRCTVTLLLSRPASAALLQDVADNGRIAVVFSEPDSHRTLQLKGTDAREVGLEPGDPARAQHHVDRFVARLEPLGYPVDVLRTLLACAPEDLAALAFTPSSGSFQTPGPEAGTPLRSAS